MKRLFLFFLWSISINVYAQNNTVSSGGQANGIGGSVSYSLGQISYSSFSSNSNILTEGIQQNYEISIFTSIDNFELDSKIKLYPNPTLDKLTMNIDSRQFRNIQYLLVDLQGKIILSGSINSSKQNFDFSRLNNGIYFLRLSANNKQMQTFRVIKNK